MNTLIRHIEYLLARKDCVIIPGLGALLANRVEASYDTRRHTLMPPRRRYTFNSGLRDNDGLLASSIQRAEGISYEAAMRRVSQGVESMTAQLRLTGELAIGHIGAIRRDQANGTLNFEAGQEPHSTAETLWLSAIELKSDTTADSGNIVEAPIRSRRYGSLRRIARAAASVAVLLGIGFVASTPMPTDDAMHASFAPEVYKVQPQPTEQQEQAAAILDIALPSSQDAEIEATPRIRPELPMYYVIVASLVNEEDAALYISQHQGEELKAITNGRIHQVYSSVHTDVYEAYRASYKADKTHPGAWVYKK